MVAKIHNSNDHNNDNPFASNCAILKKKEKFINERPPT